MTTKSEGELGYILIGTASSVGIGGLLFQALGALVLGLCGALGSYLFVKLLKPKFDKLLDKLKTKQTANETETEEDKAIRGTSQGLQVERNNKWENSQSSSRSSFQEEKSEASTDENG